MFSGFSKEEDEDERDTEDNPYPDKWTTITVSASARNMYMEESTHKYLIMKQDKGYSGYILTGSKGLAYAKACVKNNSLSEWLEPPKTFEEDFPTFYEMKEERHKCQPHVAWGSRMRAAQVGKLFHWYVEQRIEGKDVGVPKGIEKEVKQLNRYFEQVPIRYFAGTEVGFFSFRHRICGSIDALLHNPITGEYTIVDWKNSTVLFESGKPTRQYPLVESENKKGYTDKYVYEDNFEILPGVFIRVYHPRNLDNFNDKLFGHMVQTAVYRKLMLLNGKSVSHISYINVVSAQLESEAIGLDPELRVIRCNLRKVVKKYGVSPVCLAERIFEHHKEQLEQLFYPKKRFVLEDEDPPLMRMPVIDEQPVRPSKKQRIVIDEEEVAADNVRRSKYFQQVVKEALDATPVENDDNGDDIW